jgi:hypothetical protein
VHSGFGKKKLKIQVILALLKITSSSKGRKGWMFQAVSKFKENN